MKIDINKSFDLYFNEAEKNTTKVIGSDSKFLTEIKELHHYYVNKIFPNCTNLSHHPIFLTMNSFMLLQSALRLAFSGHEAAIFPQLRTALESVCYAFLITVDHELESIWLARHKNIDTHKLCRKEFTDAVKKTANKLKSLNFIDEETYNAIYSGYQSTIDLGAHPNPKSILPHICISNEREDKQIEVLLTGLYCSQSPQMNRIMLTCLEIGLLMSLILSSTLILKKEELVEELTPDLIQMLKRKEMLVKEHFNI